MVLARIRQQSHLDWITRWRNKDDKLFHPSNLINGDVVKKYLKSKGKKIKLGYDISQIIKILNKNEKNGLNVAFGSFILIGKIYEAYNLKI